MTTMNAQQPKVINAETMPAQTAVDSFPPNVTPEKPMPTSVTEIIPPSSKNEDSLDISSSTETDNVSSGGFFGSLRKKIRSAAGIESQFVNPYLGKDHSGSKMPPYGQEQTSPSPATFPTSSMIPSPSLYQQYNFPPSCGDEFHQQQQAMMMMMNGMPPPPHSYGIGMPMMMNPGMVGGYFGGVPPQHRGPAPFLYPSNSLLDYAYSMHDPYLGTGRPYHGAGYHPFGVSALPVQDKRLLPERNYISAVKDIWQTNLQ